MSLDPTEYDLSELRRIAGVGDPTDSDAATDGGGRSDRGIGGPNGDPTGIPNLGSAGGDRVPGGPPPGRGRAGGERDPVADQVLTYQTGATGAMLERPYLPRVPDTYTGVATVFEWLEFLLSNGTSHRTRQALRYYESIEWITERAREDLETYLEGMSDPDPDSGGELGMEHHRKSLLYVARLTAETYS
jgi:hypothetical protein